MNILLHLKATLMGIVEGLTEFLPISSTGHLIITRDVIGFGIRSSFVFLIAIQSAALLAVCWQYRARLLRMACGVFHDKKEQRLATNVLIGFIPAAAAGVVLHDIIEHVLFTPYVVAAMFALGGLVIFWVENRIAKGVHKITVNDIDAITWKDALKIGAIQCLSLIPGTSRSGATIIGGVFVGLSRTVATEFSFFLAMPMIGGATVYALWKTRDSLALSSEWPLYVTAGIAAFISAFLCVRWLLRYVGQHDFRIFAWYRIIFGGIILLTAFTDWINWS
ncbi:MAG: undecaprenyl-diphosphate phosphatase [Alphaproteobacteria bacterium]|nr:undecaprenyl-diphosphate phosphatase [Alphaproteobacteria bacterium]